jgi:hypothetical protein
MFWERIMLRPQRVLFMLDGYDEVADLKDAHVEHMIQQAPNVLLTSRPYPLERGRFDRTLEVIGFTDDAIGQYVSHFFGHRPDFSEAVLRVLQENPSVHGTAHVPINLELLCSLFDLRGAKPPREATLTSLYDGIVELLLRRYVDDKVPGQSTEDWDGDEVEEFCLPILCALEKLAFDGLMEGNLVFDDDQLKPALEAGCELADGLRRSSVRAQLRRSGFLQVLTKGGAPWARSYQFLHLTFQEFFAARYIARRFQSPLNDDRAWLETLMLEQKYNRRFEYTWWFVAGILAKQAGPGSVQQFFDWLESGPRDLSGFREDMLRIRCGEEAGIKLDTDTIAQLREHLFQRPRAYRRWSRYGGVPLWQYLHMSPQIERQLDITGLLLDELQSAMDEDSPRASNAVWALRELGFSTEKLLPILEPRLDDANEAMQLRAIEILLRADPPAESAVQRALELLDRSPGGDQGSRLLSLLADTKSGDNRILAHMRLALEQGRAVITAARYLVDRGIRDTSIREALLIAAVTPRFPNVKALETLSRLGDLTATQLKPIVDLAMEDAMAKWEPAQNFLLNAKLPSETFRYLVAQSKKDEWGNVCEVLAAQADRSSVIREWVNSVVQGTTPHPRRSTFVASVGDRRDATEQERSLLAHLATEDDDTAVRRAALQSLIKIGATGPEAEEAFCKGAVNAAVGKEAISALTALPTLSRRAISALVDTLEGHWEVAEAAADALRKLDIREKRVLDALERARRKDRNDYVRVAATRALMTLRGGYDKYIDYLCAVVRSRSLALLRANAAAALGTLPAGHPRRSQVIELLIGEIPKLFEWGVEKAVTSLAQLGAAGDPRAIQVLLQELAAPKIEGRRLSAVLSGLAQLGPASPQALRAIWSVFMESRPDGAMWTERYRMETRHQSAFWSLRTVDLTPILDEIDPPKGTIYEVSEVFNSTPPGSLLAAYARYPAGREWLLRFFVRALDPDHAVYIAKNLLHFKSDTSQTCAWPRTPGLEDTVRNALLDVFTGIGD